VKGSHLVLINGKGLLSTDGTKSKTLRAQLLSLPISSSQTHSTWGQGTGLTPRHGHIYVFTWDTVQKDSQS